MSDYRDPIVEKYLDLFRDELGGIKKFYNGTLVQVPASYIPMLMIDVEGVEIEPFSNTEDQHRIDLVLTYIADMRKESSAAQMMKKGFQKVNEVLIGRNDSDYTLKAKSVADILRNNLDIDSGNQLRTDVGSITVIAPKEVSLGRLPGYWSAEGTVRFQSHFVQSR